jgi:hypothetical protein
MIDRRVRILNRLVVLQGDIVAALDANPAPLVYRNRAEIDEMKLPAMLLLDGSEETVQTKITTNRGGGPMPAIMRFRPQLFALLKRRIKTKAADEYAPEIAAYRNATYLHLMFDEQLLDILGPNGGIVYRGFDTDFETGRSMWGELQFYFDFQYPLIPSELQEV